MKKLFNQISAYAQTTMDRWRLNLKKLRRKEYHQKYIMTLREWLVFHQKEIVFKHVKWLGTQILKNPLDAWIYQEIIYDVKPDVIVEIGSKYGGSTKYFANLLDLLENGIVVSIDIDRSKYHLEHKRVSVLTGDSASPEIIEAVARLCKDKTVLVIHDGDHRKEQVLKDLDNYAPFVTPGSYYIVEDGIVDLFHYGDGLGFKEPGPLAAVEEFLSTHSDFIVDKEKERYMLTYNPNGFLKRVSHSHNSNSMG
jgi:cephalosporin hydroxylase